MEENNFETNNEEKVEEIFIPEPIEVVGEEVNDTPIEVDSIDSTVPVEPIETSEKEEVVDTVETVNTVEESEREAAAIIAAIKPQDPTISQQPYQPPVNEEPTYNQSFNNQNNNNSNNNSSGNGGVIVSLILIILLVIAVVGFVVNNPFAGEKVENSSTPTPSATPTSTPTPTPTPTPTNTPVATPKNTATPKPTSTPTSTPQVSNIKTVTCTASSENYSISNIVVYDEAKKQANEIRYSYSFKVSDTLPESDQAIISGLALSAMEFDKFKDENGVDYDYNETEEAVKVNFIAKRTEVSSANLITKFFNDLNGMSANDIANEFKNDPDLTAVCSIK